MCSLIFSTSSALGQNFYKTAGTKNIKLDNIVKVIERA